MIDPLNWSPKIMIVDDQELNVNLLERILKRQGYENIQSLTDSTQAMALIERFQPDLILLDYHMPVVNGLDILSELKAMDNGDAYLPVIVLTADTSQEVKQQALAMGAKDFLAKPLERTEVVLRIRNLLDTRRLYLEIGQQNVELQSALVQLKEAQGQLVEHEKMASLGKLTAGIAHEINNPINFISSNVGSLRRDVRDLLLVLEAYDGTVKREALESTFASISELKDDIEFLDLIEEIDQLLAGVEEGARRTAEIVKDLRSFSRLDEDVLKLASVEDGIRSTLALLRTEYEPRIQVTQDYAQVPAIECYPGKLNQVFMNLLSNAIQAIPHEGTIHIAAAQIGDSVEVQIQDSGTGMSEEVKNRIFEPFYTTKDVGVGTGLGLSITYSIVQRHQGTIEVESVPGKGTTFILRIPIKQTNQL